MATAPTLPPVDGAALPTPPTTLDPANFDARMDAWLTAQVSFQADENALKDNVYANTQAAYANAQATAADATAVAYNAALVATFAGAAAWVPASNYVVNDVKRSPTDGRAYFCWAIATGLTTDPSADPTHWRLVGTERPLIVVTGTTVACVAGFDYVLTNVAATTATLPATPTSGDPGIRFWMANGLTTNVIARNAQTIMGSATDMTYDVANSNPEFRFISNTWRFRT